MDQQQFGTWAAIAIHDTSSVVGAGAAYGEEALKVATTIKLTRALLDYPDGFCYFLYFQEQRTKDKYSMVYLLLRVGIGSKHLFAGWSTTIGSGY